jgi:predicted ribosome quality control (RQC) complex YloA/Tae2 family protein
MYRNYFYLYRCTKELNSLIKGSSLLEAFTQEKDKLFLKIPLQQYPDHHIILDCSPLLNYINSRERHFKAKKNTISFFDSFLPVEIKSVKIALNDRAIAFELSNSILYFIIQGGITNAFIDADGSKAYFKKNEDDKISPPERFVQNEEELFTFLEAVDAGVLEWKLFSKKFPFAGKELFLQAKAALKTESTDEFKACLKLCIEKILTDKIAVYYDANEAKPRFLPESFIDKNSDIDQVKTFDKYFDALNYYLGLKHRNANEVSIKNKIEKYLNTEIEKLASKLNNLKFRIDAGTKEAEYRAMGSLLLANINKIQRGAASIDAEDPETGEITKIKLDSKLSPQKNIDRCFEKSRDEKIGYEQSKELYKAALERMNRLNELKEEADSDIPQEDLEKIFNKLKINQQVKTNRMEDKFNFKHYILHGKYHVYVGRDSRNNDELTTQFAKQNDLWFHARGSAGSHVVLRVESTKEAVPKNIIKEAAALAAYFSKAKTSGMAPVAYTFRKYVHKKKGLEPGQVIMSREDVVLVRPEIPKECEPVVSELI